MDIPKFIEIVCPKCETEYRIPVDYCGKDAVCSNESCGVMFEIPTLEVLMAPDEVIEPEAPPEDISTNTVRIERSGFVGMIPDPEKIKNGLDTSNFVMMSGSAVKKKRVFRISKS